MLLNLKWHHKKWLMNKFNKIQCMETTHNPIKGTHVSKQANKNI
jgi:hypothetical protein